jgi:peptide/nickel transport system permease protein
VRARELWRRFWAQRLARVALLTLAGLAAVAVGADCLASDLPILMRFEGKLYVLPNVTRPGELRRHDVQSLRRAFGPDDWAVDPLIPYGPQQTQPGGRLDINQPPGGAHWLGTDDVGRDVAAQLVHGARSALAVGVLSVLLYVWVGLWLGALAGYLGGVVDTLTNWAVAVMATFPTFLLVLGIAGLLQARSLWGLVLVLGLTGWASVARIVRGEVLRAVAQPHVLAARSLGASHPRILVLHVLPAAAGPVAVAATFGMAGAILMESGLSFLGLGSDAASWGRLLAIAQVNRAAWWLALFPGIAISVTVLAYNFVAEGIQDAQDPRVAIRTRPSRWRRLRRKPDHRNGAPEQC